jgi:hypothetical protein
VAIPTRATESFPNVHTRVLKYYHLFFLASNLVKVAPRDAAERRRRETPPRAVEDDMVRF